MVKAEFITGLKTANDQHVQLLLELSGLDHQLLTKQESRKSWNALQCCEHMVRVNQHYLKHINYTLSKTSSSTKYNAGWFGGYFAKMNGSNKKMVTFKSINPTTEESNPKSIAQLQLQLESIAEIIETLHTVDLTCRVPSLVGSWLTFKLGDALQLVANHNGRHLGQALQATRS